MDEIKAVESQFKCINRYAKFIEKALGKKAMLVNLQIIIKKGIF